MEPSNRIRGKGRKLKPRNFHPNVKKSFFTVSVTEHWQTAWIGCGVFFPGDLQNSHGAGPAPPTLDVPAWVRGLDYMVSRSPFQPEPFWLFLCVITESRWLLLISKSWLVIAAVAQSTKTVMRLQKKKSNSQNLKGVLHLFKERFI